jgi:hypothetical protein
MIQKIAWMIGLAVAGLWASTVFAAGPLTCSVQPAGNATVNSMIQVKATGGKGPYWLTVGTPALVSYTPSKTERSGNPGGTWNLSVIKPGQAAFTVRDAAGATASATLTITAPGSPGPPSSVPPLAASLSNRSPFTGESVTLTISGGMKPYRVSADPPANASVSPINDTSWGVKALREGEFKINIQDAGQRTSVISGKAQNRLVPLNAAIDRNRLYWQVRPGTAQQPITLQIISGNPPYSVLVDRQFLDIRQSGPGTYSITSNGRGGDTTIKLQDSKRQEKSWTIHAAAPLSIKWIPENRTLKAGENFTVLILGGEPPFSVKTGAAGAYVGEGMKDSRYMAGYQVGGLKAGVHKIQVTDASFPTTNFGFQIEVKVEP